MSATFVISIPERYWKPLQDEIKDGRLVWIRDENGNVDLAQWNRNEWNAELGSVKDPVAFADVAIIEYPDRDGMCGRCGRYRGGP